MTPPEAQADVVVLGSGAAGLVAAVVAAQSGASVVVLERSNLVGGTTAVSGGMVWAPCNHHMGKLGIEDSRDDALAYVSRCTDGKVAPALCAAFVDTAAEMVAHLETTTPARFRPVMRPDYRPEWPGGRLGGRTLDNLPFDSRRLGELPLRPRRAALPLTHDELIATRYASRRSEIEMDEVRRRAADGVVTLGAALAGSLALGCVESGVRFRTGVRARELVVDRGRVAGVRAESDAGTVTVRAHHGVVVATGGFEWSAERRNAFIDRPLDVPISPPWNEGDGLAMGQRVGATLGNMTEAWWVPTYLVPGETYDDLPLGRHLAAELSLPGSILVNRVGQRFVNESINYNDLSAAFAVRDPETAQLANVPCWLVFDDDFRKRYLVTGCAPGAEPPEWWHTASTIEELASLVGIDAGGLAATVSEFNADALGGQDRRFRRGESAHDRFYGDPEVLNPCLAPLGRSPYYCIEVRPGAFGTKGGLVVDERARVLDVEGAPVAGLFAAGNASAGVTGPGYPGAGATLASAMVLGFLAGRELTAAS